MSARWTHRLRSALRSGRAPISAAVVAVALVLIAVLAIPPLRSAMAGAGGGAVGADGSLATRIAAGAGEGVVPAGTYDPAVDLLRGTGGRPTAMWTEDGSQVVVQNGDPCPGGTKTASAHLVDDRTIDLAITVSAQMCIQPFWLMRTYIDVPASLQGRDDLTVALRSGDGTSTRLPVLAAGGGPSPCLASDLSAASTPASAAPHELAELARLTARDSCTLEGDVSLVMLDDAHHALGDAGASPIALPSTRVGGQGSALRVPFSLMLADGVRCEARRVSYVRVTIGEVSAIADIQPTAVCIDRAPQVGDPAIVAGGGSDAALPSPIDRKDAVRAIRTAVATGSADAATPAIAESTTLWRDGTESTVDAAGAAAALASAGADAATRTPAPPTWDWTVDFGLSDTWNAWGYADYENGEDTIMGRSSNGAIVLAAFDGGLVSHVLVASDADLMKPADARDNKGPGTYCRPQDLTARVSDGGGAGGTTYEDVVLNASLPCTVFGQPVIIPRDASGAAVGPGAAFGDPDVQAADPLVRLGRADAIAVSRLGVATASNLHCTTRTAVSLDVVLPTGGTVSVPIDPVPICADTPTAQSPQLTADPFVAHRTVHTTTWQG